MDSYSYLLLISCTQSISLSVGYSQFLFDQGYSPEFALAESVDIQRKEGAHTQFLHLYVVSLGCI